MKISDKPTLKVAEVSRILGLGLNQTYEGIKRGQIPAIKIGGRYLVPTAKLEALLNAVSASA